MPPIIMCREPIDLGKRTPLSIARLSASAPSSHDLSLAAFTINIAESNFRHTQVRAFNTLSYMIFAREANRPVPRLAVPIAGDDQEAVQVAAGLVRDARLAPA